MMHDHQNSNSFCGLHTNISITTEWDYETLTSFQGTAFQDNHIKITLKTMFQCSIGGQGGLECCVKIRTVGGTNIFMYKYGMHKKVNFKVFIFFRIRKHRFVFI